VIIRWKEILVAVLEPNFRGRIDVDHRTDFFVNAQKFSRGHERLAGLIGRHPELHDGFIPAVLLPTAVNGIERRRFDLGQVIAGVNRVAIGIYKQQGFIRCPS